MKRIFITGAAGFIGFHLAIAARRRGDFVVGLDLFNNYYSPELKRTRQKLLLKEGIEVVEGDICNTPLLKQLIQQQGITHVAHLAAQAGVRHSLTHPNDYVDANLQGFLSVLEACRSFPEIKLTYASSSSVYGLNKKIPFSVEDRTDEPTNLYGATKKANEMMAHAYHHLFGLPVTALRYFTVYGPWGRPDMAYYSFAQRIWEGKPIQLFNQGKMRRDFTYIDDIVKGTLAAIDLGAACEVFNLGNHRPVDLLYFVQVLENSLEKKADLEFLPMQPGEVVETFADIEKSQRLLNFQPSVTLEEGIPHFVEWFIKRNGARGEENRSDQMLNNHTKSLL
ncbi:MAG: NAD-dependent epimerase/dehydratase family protein [Verrucomicrobiota bacterium]|nr:NAD-dependent epimerase/dehydratase family protein [Verrucomicrobiota bacterium]